MNKFYRVTGTAVAALTLAASAAASSAPYAAARATAPHAAAAAASAPAPHPNIPAALPASVAAGSNSIGAITKVGSNNWAGYAVTGSRFKKIKASFYVPIMNCSLSPAPTGEPGTFSSHWVGLDGFSNKTVEQTGIEADCINGHEQVFAWREVFPHPEQPFNMTIRPGDSITARVVFRNGRFKLKVKDNTTGQHRTVRPRCAALTCHRSSAEVISEAPLVSGKQSSLADYGAQAFSGIAIRNSRGQTGGIRSSHWNAFRIFQVGFMTNHIIAAPTSLHGPAFAVYWLGEN